MHLVVEEALVKTVISVLDIGGFCTDESRASLTNAAKVWGADINFVTEDLVPWSGCKWFAKYFARKYYQGYDAVLQIDADVFVKANAPSPFLEWCGSGLGMVREHQPEFGWGNGTAGFWEEGINSFFYYVCGYWSSRMQMPPPLKSGYFNGGFMIYKPSEVDGWFDQLCEFGAIEGHNGRGLSDQTILSIMAHNGLVPVQPMRSVWNAIHAGRTTSLCGPSMDRAYIYHFCGKRNRRSRMAKVDWRLP